MIRLVIKSKLHENYNQLIPNIEVQRDDLLETVIHEYCNKIGIQYEPLMYLKAENGEFLTSSSKIEYYYRLKFLQFTLFLILLMSILRYFLQFLLFITKNS